MSLSLLSFLPSYFLWHYSGALVDLARIGSNFFWGLSHFFSLEILGRSFFVPWKRLDDAQRSFAGRAVVGVSMRALGVLARIGVFALAAVAFSVLGCMLAAAFILWLLAPFLIILLLATGIRALL